MSAFDDFTNPYQNALGVPDKYKEHPSLQRLFKADGMFVRPAEDPVTLWAIEVLHTQYNVPLEAMTLELNTEFGSRAYQARVDVVIHDDRYINASGSLDVTFIILEAMEPNKKLDGADAEGWQDHYTRLEGYASLSPSARYAILTSGTYTRIYRRDLEYPRKLELIGELPQYESAREAAERSPYTVVLNPDEPDGIETGLQPLTRNKFREVLGDTRSGCHSILRDNEGLQPQEAVDAMVKFLFAKWYDEQATVDLVKETQEKRAYAFSYNAATDPERLVIQVRETFELAKQWEIEQLKRKSEAQLNIRTAFNEADQLMFQPHTTVDIVKKLQPYSLRRSSADVKGGVFEDFLGKTFRDDLGQYFTPTPIISLMIGIMQPTVDDVIGDPACGSARMLTHALDYVRKFEYEKAASLNGGSFEGINPEEPSRAFIKFRDNNLFGSDMSRNVMHVARVNALMNGAPFMDLKVMDTLVPLDSITNGVLEGIPEHTGFYRGGLTMIVTNPPFGSKVTNKRVLEDFAARDGVSINGSKIARSLPQEVAFINRCLEFLAPGGKLGIVLPDGVLANSSMQYVREWILRNAILKAVISLPQETFSPYGAGVKTSVVILQKREAPISSIDDVSKEDYEIYMARIDNVGYDATGRLLVNIEESHEPPEVKETIEDFNERLGW